MLNNINAHDWKQVSCKASTKAVAKLLTALAANVTGVTISNAFGSVYFDIECEERGILTVRVSDHEQTSNSHAQPHVNIVGKLTEEHKKQIKCLVVNETYHAPRKRFYGARPAWMDAALA